MGYSVRQQLPVNRTAVDLCTFSLFLLSGFGLWSDSVAL